MLNKSSCFIDCIEIALGLPAHVLDRDYRDLLGESEHDPSEDGYHPTIVNVACLERFGQGLVEVELRPAIYGHTFGTDTTGYVTDWFDRSGLRCVVTGPRDNGEEHANAYINGKFVDSTGEVLDEPNIQIRSLWCLSVPKFEC